MFRSFRFFKSRTWNYSRFVISNIDFRSIFRILYNTTDVANTTTYIRYTPASLADNTKVKAALTQL